MIKPHAEKVPEELLNEITHHRVIKNINLRLDSSKSEESFMVVVVKDTPRDRIFYIGMISSFLLYGGISCRIIAVIDDANSDGDKDWFPAHEHFFTSDIEKIAVKLGFEHNLNPFFHRIFAPVAINILYPDAKSIIVSDNDIIFLNNIGDLNQRHVTARYSKNSNSELAKILIGDAPVGSDFLKNRAGSFGDFIFFLPLDQDTLSTVLDKLREKFPDNVSSIYSSYWLRWISIVQCQNNKFEFLDEYNNDKMVYMHRNNPLIFHVGGGYEREKLPAFLMKSQKSLQELVGNDYRFIEMEKFLQSTKPISVQASWREAL